MKCRELEDRLSDYFNGYDFRTCAEASATGNWSHFIPIDEDHQMMLEHLAACSDCANSLLWYLEIKETVNYHEYPCLHLAYGCNHAEHPCIERHHDGFSIILDRQEKTGIVIGNCPWCGIGLFPTKRHEDTKPL